MEVKQGEEKDVNKLSRFSLVAPSGDGHLKRESEGRIDLC
jgi:hypothetical protein